MWSRVVVLVGALVLAGCSAHQAASVTAATGPTAGANLAR